MSGLGWFLLGMVASPALVVVGYAAAEAVDTGISWWCPCGYDTGDRQRTRRIVARARWFWHRRLHPAHAFTLR